MGRTGAGQALGAPPERVRGAVPFRLALRGLAGAPFRSAPREGAGGPRGAAGGSQRSLPAARSLERCTSPAEERGEEDRSVLCFINTVHRLTQRFQICHCLLLQHKASFYTRKTWDYVSVAQVQLYCCWKTVRVVVNEDSCFSEDLACHIVMKTLLADKLNFKL